MRLKLYPDIPGDKTVIPTNLNGDAVLISAKEKVIDVYNALCYGTGRVMSRSDTKTYAESFDYDALRNTIYIPQMISNDSIKTEAPFCYRDIDNCLTLIDDLVTVEKRFSVFAYMGQF